MTLDEAIKHAEEVAKEYQRVVDTGIVFNDVTIDMLYCDDTEVIEEHLANYQRCVEEHRQLVEWLKELKMYREMIPSASEVFLAEIRKETESDHKCHNCKHYMSGEQDGSCDSYICEHYSGWESEE